MRNSVIIYKSFYESLKYMAPDQQAAILMAVLDYGLNDTEPANLQGLEMALFTAFKPQIDANNTKYENGKKGGQYGVLGGRPAGKKETPRKPQENPKKTPQKPQENPTETPNVNDNVNVKDNVKDNDNVNVKESEKRKKTPAGVSRPQDKNEITDFFKTIGLNGQSEKEAEKFLNHFTATGWKIGGRAAMKDWRAAARNWAARVKSGEFTRVTPPAPPPVQTRDKIF